MGSRVIGCAEGVASQTTRPRISDLASPSTSVTVHSAGKDFPGSGIRSVALEGEAGWQLQGNINRELKPANPISYLAPGK